MKAIAAMDPYRVIGNKGKIPWHFSEDFKWFKQMTMGEILVMGRSTFESIGKPLPGRFTYILTNDPSKYQMAHGTQCGYINGESLKQVLAIKSNVMWLCGGAKVYQEFLPYCNEIYMTHIIEEYEGDTYMPEFEPQFPNSETLRETKDYWIVRYFK